MNVKCDGCNGRGEIGGVTNDGSWQTDPCPFCDGTGIGSPLTDANASNGWSGDAVCVDVEFARALERKLAMAEDALDYICRRLQMDIDDGSRPDQYTMQDLVRKAKQIPF